MDPRACTSVADPKNFSFLNVNPLSVDLKRPTCPPANIEEGNDVQLIMSALFSVDCVYREGLGFDDVVSLLKVGHAVQFARRVGHYVVAVDHDEANDLLVYWDSFGLFVGEDESLTDDGTGGFRRTMTRDFFASDLWPRFIEIVG